MQAPPVGVGQEGPHSGHLALEPRIDAEQSNPGGKRWTRPLRWLLGIAIVALLVILSAALIGLEFRRGREAAIAEARTGMRVFSERLVDRFGILSGDTVTLVDMVASVANAFLVPPPERIDDKIAILRDAVLRSPHIDGVYVGYRDGAFFHVVDLDATAWRKTLRAPDDAAIAVRLMGPLGSSERLSRVMFLNAAGRTVAEGSADPTDYDPRLRPWYRGARAQDSPISVGPYEMATTHALGVTVAQRHTHDPTVVIGADILMEAIQTFLGAERMTPETVAFIVDASGRPVIHSDPGMMRRLLSAKSEDGTAQQLASDPLAEAVHSGNWGDGNARIVTVDGRNYLATVTPIRSALVLSGHRIVVAAPLDELLAPALTALRHGVMVSAALVALAVIAALLMARWITRSLNELTASADRLQMLDFATPVEVSTHVSEISMLGTALNRARDAIASFTLYVPREVVREGFQAGAFAGRAAKRQEVTALFSDIYDFTTISERLSPEEVVAMLSDYFDIFGETVEEHGGAIIQFNGDSVFAMWNAPAEEPRHAEKACLCALAVEAKLHAYNLEQRIKGLPQFRTRYGIHSGIALVGNVGARDRLQYTAMGDTVNVASRLEGMNKDYGTAILASGSVVAQCGDTIRFRPLGKAQAKGRARELEVFEVLAAAPALSEAAAG